MESIMPRQSGPRLESTGRDSAPSTPFGISRSPSQRIELVFALRNGGVLALTHDLGAPVSAESLDKFCTELRQSVGSAGDWREFGDAWSGSGQRSYVQLSEVIGFTARPAR